MSDPGKPSNPATTGSAHDRVRSFLGWAFLISLVIHAITLPFFGLKAQQHKSTEVEKVSVTKKIKVIPPTPPPPTPTPPPPTPPPKSPPPPVKQTNPPPQVKLKLNVVKTEHKSDTSAEKSYVAPKVGSEEGNPNGTEASGPPAPASTAIAATPAPTPAPPTATPKPTCPNPNEDATIKGSAVEPDYPEMAKQQGDAGTTEVKVTLDATGNPVDTSVYKSSGFAILDQAALKAARATQYNAELVNCVKTAGSYLFTADFTGQ